jgi:curved DNA-binding protein CbpA
LIIKILQFRKENAKGTADEQETEDDYNSYQKEFETSKNEKIATLTEDEQKELKSKYRQASKLCHPDLISEDQKELASKLFAELSNAYECNDLEKLREILKNLEHGNFFISKSDEINEKESLKNEIEKLRLLIKELKEQMKIIIESPTYETIINIKNWEDYFSNAKKELSLQLNDLENERQPTNTISRRLN